MYTRTAVQNDGLGFIGPLVGAGISIGGALLGRPKAPKPSREESQEIVRQLYLEIFGREPDPGSKGWVDCLVEGDCDVQKVRDGLFGSAEYADKKAKGVLPSQLAQTGGLTFTSGGTPGLAPFPDSPMMGGMSSMMQYAPYAIGGIVLLALLRKK